MRPRQRNGKGWPRFTKGIQMSRNHSWTTVVLLAIVACLCGCSAAPSHLAYVTLSNSQIAVYRVDNSSGLLTPLAGSPYPAGIFPTSIAVHPSGKFVYVANTGEGDVSFFSINAATGAITEIQPRAPAGANPTSLAFAPDGSELFVANSGSGTVSAFSINPRSGSLSQVSGSPFVCGISPVGIAVSSPKTVYVADSTSDVVFAFSINSSTGGLTAVPGSPFATGGSNPTSVAIDASGRFL